MKSDILLQHLLFDGRVSHHRNIAISILYEFNSELQFDEVDLFDFELHDVPPADKPDLDVLLLGGGKKLNFAQDLLFGNLGQFRNVLPFLFFFRDLIPLILLQQLVDIQIHRFDL